MHTSNCAQNFPENKDYFKGPENVERVRVWRKNNPGYWKRPKIQTALQDPLTRQVAVNKQDTSNFTSVALQDALIMQPAVVIGLIAQFTGYALQDDIAMAARRMQQFGNDILNLQGGCHGTQTTHLPGPYP
jgi:hypothetical protein